MLQNSLKVCIFDRKTNHAMKKRVLTAFFIVIAVTAFAASRVLTAVSVPDIDMSHGAVNVLFSRISGDGIRSLRITAHGDSLSVESDGRRRQWFAWRSDTAYYAGEESMYAIEGPRVPVAGFGFPLASGDSRSNSFRIYGTEDKVRHYVRDAVYSSETGGRGSLVLPEGDTLKGVVTVREILATVTDSVEFCRETVRWFRGGERLPVAVYIREGESAVCYAMDAYELRNECNKDEADDYRLSEAIGVALESAIVSTAGGYIDIVAEFPDNSAGAVLCIGVTDVPGHLYAMEERAADGKVVVRIPTTGLRAGEYIVGLSLSWPAKVEKRYISVGL